MARTKKAPAQQRLNGESESRKCDALRLVLEVVRGPCTAQMMVAQDDVVTIGRTRKTIFCFRDLQISELHAELVCTGSYWTVRDTSSSNGTTINGHPVGTCRSMRLKDGDILSFGSTTSTKIHITKVTGMGEQKHQHVLKEEDEEEEECGQVLAASGEGSDGGRGKGQTGAAIAAKARGRWRHRSLKRLGGVEEEEQDNDGKEGQVTDKCSESVMRDNDVIDALTKSRSGQEAREQGEGRHKRTQKLVGGSGKVAESLKRRGMDQPLSHQEAKGDADGSGACFGDGSCNKTNRDVLEEERAEAEKIILKAKAQRADEMRRAGLLLKQQIRSISSVAALERMETALMSGHLLSCPPLPPPHISSP